jgi:glutamyl-Q tRNA(Asp) synthetase
MDDLDRQRVIPGMADDILRTLETLGFEWDGAPVWQSRRNSSYHEALAQLQTMGRIYPCGCSRGEIARIATAPHGKGEEIAYPGTCRSGISAGKEPRALRVRVTEQPVCFPDGISGEYCQNLTEICGDFIVRRADGLFAYHLATVVDDASAGVNQVVRGADLLFSTPRQIYLQQLLGLQQPDYFHLPLVTASGGAKLSKRDNAVSLAANRNLNTEGWAVLLAALGFLGQPLPDIPAGTAPAEILRHAASTFEPALVPTAGGPFPEH